MSENKDKDEVPFEEDDAALFDVITYLMERLAESKDARVADITNFAMEQCRKDPHVVAKLLVRLSEIQKHQQEPMQPYNPFVSTRQRR